MCTNHPPFYKYMTEGTGRAVLRNLTLRWSTPGTLNDPYDVQFDLQINVDRPSLKQKVLQKLWDAHYGDPSPPIGNALGMIIHMFRGKYPKLSREEFDQEFGEAFEESMERSEKALARFHKDARAQLEKSKILCLTTSPDNIVMWSHYAEKHQGMVLKFRSVPELDSPWCMARPIQYVADMPSLLDEEFFSDMLSGRVSMDPGTILNRMIYTKSAEWSYEKEWRIFSGTGRNPEAPFENIPFHAQELEAVIVGCCMPQSIRSEFVSHIQQHLPHVNILEAERAENRFRLNLVEFNTRIS